MTRLAYSLALAAALAALAALPAGAYQHLAQDTGSGVSPDRWQALPLDLVVDNGADDILPEIGEAVAAWNAVTTARDPFGTLTRAVDGAGNPVDFTGANFLTDWGDLTGDGRHEVIFDKDGTGLIKLGFAPGSVNGFGAQHEVVAGGQAVIDDMFLIINGTGVPAFDRRATEVHELGHTLGLAHSSVGFAVGKDGALSPVLESQVPTMHPFAIAGTDRRTLEADDRAALSELYPEATFTTTTGTIAGKVTRCGSGDPVVGANVRAINAASPAIQLTRVTGYDGRTDGSYEINGVPPGDYFVVVEPLAGDNQFFDRLALYTDHTDTNFTQEFLNESKEPDCTQDTDPAEREAVPVAAGAETPADLKVQGATLALVVDVTGSMGPEIGGIKTSLETMIDTLEGRSGRAGTFPRTAIVTFEDSATVRTVSNDPDRLRDVIDGLTTHSTADCPEGSNAALMTAARLLGNDGEAVLVTDADSHPTGPSRASVEALYRSKGVRLSVLLSGSCPPPPAPRAARAAAPAPTVAPVPGAGPDTARVPDALGVEGSIRTFSEEALFAGGLFSFQPEVKTGAADAKTRYANTLANLAISAVTPAVAALAPATVPQGTTLDVELTGSNTGFRRGASRVAIAGGGVTVTATDVRSPTRIVARVTAAPGAAPGFRAVSVSTDRGDGTLETATGLGAVQVVAAPSTPTVLAATPGTVAAGAAADVSLSGALTHFAAGASVADFGAGVTVNRLTVASPTSAVASVTVESGAGVGFRDVTVRTGGETARRAAGFLVAPPTPAVARLTAARPSAGTRGETVDVVLTGADTAFRGGTSRATVSGTGVQVLATTVSGPAGAVARLRIAPDAPLGFRDLTVTTGAESASLLDGFEVRPAALAAETPAPSPESPVAQPTPGPSPAGGGGPAACFDRTPPSAAFTRVRAQRRRLLLQGRASDAGCGGALARVQVAIARAARHRRCRFVTAAGRLTRARRCARPVWLKARGTATWRLQTKRVPRGAYTLRVRAADRAGNVQRRPATRTRRVIGGAQRAIALHGMARWAGPPPDHGEGGSPNCANSAWPNVVISAISPSTTRSTSSLNGTHSSLPGRRR